MRRLINESIKTEPIWIDSDSLVEQLSIGDSRDHEVILNLGDCDLDYVQIRESRIYKAFHKRASGKPWDESLLLLGDVEDKKERLKNWDTMLIDIINNGYTFRELPEDRADEYISVLIGRDGRILQYNGIHRASCCLLSGIKNRIPVKVIYRHPEWESFRNSVFEYVEKNGKLYCQIPHPDLEDITHLWTNERASLIAKKSLFPGGCVLDVGSHWGTTSHTLSGHGFRCTAIEQNNAYFKMTEKISKMRTSGTGPVFDAVNTDALGYDAGDRFDTLVILNIAHHFLMKKNLYDRFMRFLNRNSFKEIFYQAHKADDKWSTQSEMCLIPEVYLGRIMKASGLNSVTKIKTFNGRALYQIHGEKKTRRVI